MIMTQAPKIMGIITARGRSKGLPQKNILDLCGKPVIAYSIEAALGSKYLDRVIVSTDDEEIASISRKYGAEVPFMRPLELATDTVPHLPVLRHAIEFMKNEEGYHADAIVLLQPTSPMRRAEDIDGAVELFIKRSADSVISVVETIYVVEESPEGTLQPLLKSQVGHFHRNYPNRLYDFNGAVYVIRRREIIERNRMLGERTYPYVMDRKRSLEIDDENDLNLVALMLKAGGAVSDPVSRR